MLDNFVFSLNATLPVFAVIVIGKILNILGIFPESFAAMSDKYVFKAALPLLLFRDISRMDFGTDFDNSFIIFCAAASVGMFLVTWFVSAVFIKNKSSVGAFAQGSARSSAAILGIVLAENICGTSSQASLMILSAVPVFNIMSVIILTVSAENVKKKINILTILKNIITNPIILGILAGIPFSLFDIGMPSVVSSALDSVSATATPMALLAIGASFRFSEAGKKFVPALFASVIKLFVLPAIVVPTAIALGFEGASLVAILVMSGAPTTVTCYIMAKNMNNDHVLTSAIVMLTTLLSALSITLWVFVLKHFAFI